MRIFVVGTRGVPEIPGGVETHCQQLYPFIVEKGHDVLICRRMPYVNDEYSEWRGICLKDIYAPKKKSIEAIVHTFLAIIAAKKWGADILHVHAVGPALMIPFARLLGLRVVFTNHGPDYDRQKWGALAKFVLRTGEKLGGLFANEVIVISEVIREIISERCHRESNLIYNGVQIPIKTEETSYIDSLGLASKSYILAVSRLVPEKGLHDLMAAFKSSGLNSKLVIAGGADHEDEYSRNLKKTAQNNPDIVLTGYITGYKLKQVFSHARLFVLPSYHEGLPIALLEALSYGLPPLVSNIPANLEVKLDNRYYFRCKDVENLKDQLVRLYSKDFSSSEKEQLIEFVKLKYDWKKIADQTILVYEKVMPSS